MYFFFFIQINNVFLSEKEVFMKKVIHIFMLFLLSLCLCGQTTQITTVYAATGKKTASTTISKKKKNKKKKNKVSVVIYSTSKAGVSTTKKVIVKKKTMKKAATKTVSTTKKTTLKKKSTKKTGAVTIITDTTVVTTVKTSTKKKSKIKTIKTTIVTTVKTTRKTTSSPANGTTVGSDFSISKFTDIKGHVNTKIYNAFTTLGFQFKINPSLSSTGMFSVRQHNIQLKIGRSSYLYHELGHFFNPFKRKRRLY